MFFILRVGNTSLILRIFSVLLSTLETYTYDLLWLILAQDSIFILKNFEILLISLGVLAGMGEKSLLILASLSLSLSLGLPFLVFRVY